MDLMFMDTSISFVPIQAHRDSVELNRKPGYSPVNKLLSKNSNSFSKPAFGYMRASMQRKLTRTYPEMTIVLSLDTTSERGEP